MTRELRFFFIALQFMTRVPVPRWVGFEPEWLNHGARHFPAVGLLVGAVAAGVLWGAATVFAMPVAVGLSMVATLVLTGAFHEDGFADTCDALGGAVDRDRALAIMKDSRIGAYGAVGLVMMLGLKAATLCVLSTPLAIPALLFGHCASRASATVLIRVLPYAGDPAHAKAKPLARRVSAVGVIVALAWVVLLGVGLAMFLPMQRVSLSIALVLVTVGTVWCARWMHRRLGGYTGDTLGATQQITELFALLGWLAAADIVGGLT